ncbi:MAG TPA: hypothetical protein VKA30_08660 [Actinomycetota bacterium]|nr:hypothetical protein [Actinomycetota bacterium]
MRRLTRALTVLTAVVGLLGVAVAVQADTTRTSGPTGPAAPCDSTRTSTPSAPLFGFCISSEGGSVSTCDVGDPKPSDNTCATLIFPPGPGGAGTLTEERAGLTICQVPLTPCMGSDVRVTLPPGYGRSNPVRLLLFYDSTTNPVGPATALMQKFGLATPVLPCVVGPLLVFPCEFSNGRIAGNDYRFGIALTSQDPKFQGLRG